MAIEHITDSLTHKMLESEFNIESLINLLNDPRFKSYSVIYDEINNRSYESIESYKAYRFHDPSVAMNLPDPNLSTHYEGSPHAWWFKDLDTGIQFIFYSDGRRKNHFKGNTLELVMDDAVTDENLAAAYERMYSFLISHNDH